MAGSELYFSSSFTLPPSLDYILHNLGQYRVNEEEGVKLRRQPFFTLPLSLIVSDLIQFFIRV